MMMRLRTMMIQQKKLRMRLMNMKVQTLSLLRERYKKRVLWLSLSISTSCFISTWILSDYTSQTGNNLTVNERGNQIVVLCFA